MTRYLEKIVNKVCICKTKAYIENKFFGKSRHSRHRVTKSCKTAYFGGDAAVTQLKGIASPRH